MGKGNRRIEQRVVVQGWTYEQEWICCGKASCWCSVGFSEQHGTRTLHGPYWYAEVVSQGRRRRIYIGKELDVRKYRAADGRVDWAAVAANKKRKRAKDNGQGCE